MQRLRVIVVRDGEPRLIHMGELHGNALVRVVTECVRLMTEEGYQTMRIERLREGP